MVLGRPKLGNLLIENGTISEEQLEAAIEYQVANGCRLGEALINLDCCTDIAITQALAEQLEIPFVDLTEFPPSPACLALLPCEVALEYGVLPIQMHGSRLLVAARDPCNIRLDEAIRIATGLQPVLALAPEGQLRDLLHQHYSESAFEQSVAEPQSEVEADEEDQYQLSLEQLTAAGEQVSTVRVVNSLIADAVRRGASDLHIEPEQTRVRVRCRIDGRMSTVVSLPSDLLQSMVARIKILCGMDISENRKPQDGSCRLKVDEKTVELRTSTLRGVHGEIVVMRILAHDANVSQLESLGFDPEMLKNFRKLLGARHGMILVTGPTGSGKTTTLYASLSHLNQEDINICTVEDPVESKLPGINQIQIHERAGRTFANILRALLRQDPDVIMVGEIRDGETAEIAGRAALTGHLVLSTLHTQSALGTIARLLEIGVAPWMVAACLNGVIAQRLVRRVCDVCAVEYTPPAGLLRALETQYGKIEGARFRQGRGCGACQRRGTRGRVGVYELLVIDDRARALLAEGVESDKLKEYVMSRGFKTMEQDAYEKACQGIVPPEEIVSLGLGVAMLMDEENDEPAVDLPSELPALPALTSFVGSSAKHTPREAEPALSGV